MKTSWKNILPEKLNEKDADMWMISVREREQWGTEVKAYNLAINRCIEALEKAEKNGVVERKK
jgi:primosomal protein N''